MSSSGPEASYLDEAEVVRAREGVEIGRGRFRSRHRAVEHFASGGVEEGAECEGMQRKLHDDWFVCRGSGGAKRRAVEKAEQECKGVATGDSDDGQGVDSKTTATQGHPVKSWRPSVLRHR